MTNIKGNLVILNGTPVALKDFKALSSSGFIYEVIRLIEGKYLFLNDHLDRLLQSCKSTKLECPEKSQLEKSLKDLIKLSSISNGNVKLTLSHSENHIRTACYFIAHFYPHDTDYLNGVHLKSYAFERPDPNIKKWNDTFRKDVRIFIEKENIYEAILLNENMKLTEGSRSNIFYIDNEGRLVSAPEKYVLPGITRKYVLDICKALEIEIVEKLLSIKELKDMKACFLSGTSPMVLPVRQLDKHIFNVQDPSVELIRERYLRLALK